MFWEFFAVYTGLNLALIEAFLWIVSAWQTNLVRNQVREQLHDTAVMLRHQISP